MLRTTHPVIKHKAGLLNLAEEFSNVSKACASWVSRAIRFTVTVICMQHQRLVNKGAASGS